MPIICSVTWRCGSLRACVCPEAKNNSVIVGRTCRLFTFSYWSSQENEYGFLSYHVIVIDNDNYMKLAYVFHKYAACARRLWSTNELANTIIWRWGMRLQQSHTATSDFSVVRFGMKLIRSNNNRLLVQDCFQYTSDLVYLLRLF
jgi:hypothetical protein